MFKMNAIDRKKVLKWALIALWGALLTYIEWRIVTVDFWQRTPAVMLVNSILVNMAQKWLSGAVVPPKITPETVAPIAPELPTNPVS